MVPSIRSHSSSPDSTFRALVEVGVGAGAGPMEEIVLMVKVGVVGEIGDVGRIGAPLLLLLHCQPMVGEIGDVIQELMGDRRGDS